MPRKLLFLLLLLTACTDGEQMRRDLATLQTRNEADSLLTDSGQADTLTDYFGHHWLSRIYGQMGELLYFNQLPYNALEAYQYAYQHPYPV